MRTSTTLASLAPIAFAASAALALGVLSACAKDGPQIVEVGVLSGRPQPPPKEHVVTARQPVVIHASGMGPPRLTVVAPSGAEVETTSTAFVREGLVTGTDVRFTPDAVGLYRVYDTDVRANELVRVNAR